MLKSTILSALAFFFLVVGWSITPVQAHECIDNNHNRLDHPHCQNGNISGGSVIMVHGGSFCVAASELFVVGLGSAIAYRVPRDGTRG